MTGYGKAQAERNNTLVTVEIKTLNSKFMELNLRLPRGYAEKEIDIRNMLTQQLERGKAGISVDLQSNDVLEAKVEYNKPLFVQYYRQLQDLAREVEAPEDDIFRMALQQPDVSKSVSVELDEEEWQFVEKVIQKAISDCDAFRQREGEILKEKLLGYVQEIKSLLQEVEKQDPHRTETIKDKLSKKLEELQLVEKLDQNRLEQELIYYIEKLDISEEKVRLLTHLNYLEQDLKSAQSNGKKLGFVAQEIGREINTIGSKANDAAIQRYVVGMKEELERIKEQVLNIL